VIGRAQAVVEQGRNGIGLAHRQRPVTPAVNLETGLLEHLRVELGAPALDFAERPAPLTGGLDTRIFAFRLRGAPPSWSVPLILRVLGLHHSPGRVLRERATQNALAELGFPAPRVLRASADPAVLGGPFLVMERVPGRPLLGARFFNLSRILVDLQLRLHALDAEALLRALDAEGRAARAAGRPPVDRDMVTLEGHLEQLESRVRGGRLDGLGPAMTWLVERRPPERGRRVICHGDFHPQNVLVDGRAVTGVIDWPNTIVADPAYDVAVTKTILSLTPIELSAVPAVVRWVARVTRPRMMRRYVAGYCRRRPLDPGALAYHEALAAMRWLVRAAESRRDGQARPGTLEASAFPERLCARFFELTGITPTLAATARTP
jgi:aminoglycoside phosphotransferase (APT) family kinase protein